MVILGKSDATITMILDNLESNNSFPNILIYNNLGLQIENEIKNDKFDISFIDSIDTPLPTVIGTFRTKPKQKLVELVNKNNFLRIIHNSCQISSTVKIGDGCIINSLVSIAAHTSIGNFVSINRNASIGHHTTVGDFATINPGCNIAGNVKIGYGTTIGIGTTIIDGIEIGDNTIIGAGSVVTKNIPDNVVAYGNPCKIIRNN